MPDVTNLEGAPLGCRSHLEGTWEVPRPPCPVLPVLSGQDGGDSGGTQGVSCVSHC